jgi:hypothetical protein
MGFIFMSMEDETGIANVIVTPNLYERERLVIIGIVGSDLLLTRRNTVRDHGVRLSTAPKS